MHRAPRSASRKQRQRLLGGSWLTAFASDLGHGKFDGAWLVQNLENQNPANTLWSKHYNLYSKIDTEATRYLDFKRWWGGHVNLNDQPKRNSFITLSYKRRDHSATSLEATCSVSRIVTPNNFAALIRDSPDNPPSDAIFRAFPAFWQDRCEVICKPQAPVMMLFRSFIGPAMVRSASKPSPVPRICTVPKSNMRPRTD